MNAPVSQLDEANRPKTGAIKFTYASGSRPLDGYTIKRGVGRGGFGEVYFATSDAGKEVAIKLIRRNLEVELRGVTQCLNLKHPNLIGLYDIRTDEMGDQWVIMEYVSGESLEEVIERNPNGVPIEQTLWWMRGICSGVAYLHDHGIVHRDLKPGNIFSDDCVVKIGDYGLAKFISCSRRSGQTESVGTVHYMAPEIANGRYGREIDTYALGIMLFEMLTGFVPFEGELEFKVDHPMRA
ncbi:MAG: serine/threonine-protein kinase, partial [Pirellulales bacterium]